MAARSGEFELIARYFAPIADNSAASLALRDDAAVFPSPVDRDIVVTTDALVADVHFRSTDSPDLVASKVLRVNLSDLAAMGATPYGLTLACGYNRDLEESWIEAFAKGLSEDCRAFDIAMLGGDTVATPGPSFFSLTALGTVPSGRALRRDQAKPGDLIAMTGTLGDAALGLAVLQEGLDALAKPHADYLSDRYWLPQPRLDVGVATLSLGVRIAAMDISDGLCGDCRKIADASNVGMIFDQSAIPLSDAAKAALAIDPALWTRVLAGGDDYELLICGSAEDISRLSAQNQTDVPITVIGEVTDQPGSIMMRNLDGKMAELAKGGFDHFVSD